MATLVSFFLVKESAPIPQTLAFNQGIRHGVSRKTQTNQCARDKCRTKFLSHACIYCNPPNALRVFDSRVFSCTYMCFNKSHLNKLDWLQLTESTGVTPAGPASGPLAP